MENNNLVILTGQSNMVYIADDIEALMPDYNVLNCARKSTNTLQWQRGNPDFDNCVSKVLVRIQKGFTPVAIMHFQGEADTDNPDTAPRWDVLAKKYFDDLRADIGYPDLPIVYAQLGKKPTNSNRLYWGTVQIKQADLYQMRPPNIYMIRTNDVVPYCPPDGAHWCEEGQLEIAGRFVNMYFSVTLS